MKADVRVIRIVSVALLVALMRLDVSAQSPNVDSISIRGGDHVRIRVGGDPRWSVTGRVDDVQRDSLRLIRDRGDTVWIPRTSVFAIETHRGEGLQTRVIVTTMLVGLAAGGAVAVVMCARDRAACAAQEQARQRAEDLDESYTGPEFLPELAGSVTGALLGWAIAPPARWELAVWPTFDTRLGGVGRGRAGFGVGVHFAF